ncbi:MAG: Mobile element protein, partial [Olavius algarvensis Gamma 3 endosymbiont]
GLRVLRSRLASHRRREERAARVHSGERQGDRARSAEVWLPALRGQWHRGQYQDRASAANTDPEEHRDSIVAGANHHQQ